MFDDYKKEGINMKQVIENNLNWMLFILMNFYRELDKRCNIINPNNESQNIGPIKLNLSKNTVNQLENNFPEDLNYKTSKSIFVKK